MNIEQWQIERQRAWTAFAAAALSALVQKYGPRSSYDFGNGLKADNTELAAVAANKEADKMILEWESRFPKPEEEAKILSHTDCYCGLCNPCPIHDEPTEAEKQAMRES